MKHHEYDNDGICIHCGHDGASTQWELSNLRMEIGNEEYFARSLTGEFNFHHFCEKRCDSACDEYIDRGVPCPHDKANHI